MRTCRLILPACFFLACLAAYAGEEPLVQDAATSAAATPAELWARVLANDFSVNVPEEAQWEAQEAAYFAAKARADYPAAFAYAVKCLQLRRSRADAIVQLKRCTILAWTTDQNLYFRHILTELYARDDLAPNLRTAIHDQLLKMAFSLRDLETVKKLNRDDGYIRLWARIVGTFGSNKPFQPDKVEDFELNPLRGAYVDEFAREVTILDDVTSNRQDGSLNLLQILPRSRRGAVYLVVLLASPDDREAVLSLTPSANRRLWLNRLPVYRGEQYQGYTLPRHLRKVKLRAGVNCLVIKQSNYANARLRVLTPQGGIDNEIHALSWKERGGAVQPLQGLHGFLASVDLAEPGLSLADTAAAASKDASTIAASLTAAEMLESAAKFQEARERRDELQAHWPESSLLLVENGLFRFRESQQGIDSRERLQKEGITLFKAALKISPQSPRAHYGLALYLQEHDETEEALKHFRKAVAAAPDWGQALVRLAQLEKTRQLDALAEKHFRAALGKFGGAEEALAGFLQSQGRREEAYALYQEQWDKGALSFNRYISLRLASLVASDPEKKWGQVEKVIAEFEKLYPDSKENPFEWRIKAARQRGQIEKAYRLLQSLAQRNGRSRSYNSRLADLALRLGWQDRAIVWLEKEKRRLLRLGQDTLPLTRRLRELRGEKWSNPEHDIPLSAIDLGRYVKRNFPTANQANLLRVVVYRIFPDRSLESFTHTAVKVFDKQGITALGELSVPSDPDDLLYCRTIQPDGQVFEPTNIKELDFSNAASMYKVSPGCVLEYAFRSKSRGGSSATIKGQFSFQDFNVPTARARLVVILPEELAGEFSVKAWPRDFAPVETRGHGTITYTWDAQDLDPVRPEPNMINPDKILRNLQILLPAPLYRGQATNFSLPTPLQSEEAISRLAKEVTADLATPREKVRALHAYLRKTLESADGARTPRDAIALGSAPPAVARNLLRAMLAAVGIQSSPANANINLDNNQAEARDRRSLIEAFTVPLLDIDLGAGDSEWLRFFSPLRHYRPADLGRGVTGAPVLVRDQDGLITLHRVYEYETEKNGVKYKTRVSLLPDGSARVQGKARFTRAVAGSMRTLADRPQEGPRLLERIATTLYPRIVITKSSYPRLASDYAGEPQADTEPFVYDFEGKIARFCRQEGDKLSFIPFPYPLRAISGLMAPPERKFPFLIRGDIEIHQEANYTAPAGWVFTEVPQNAWWLGEFGLYAVNFVVKGRNLRVSRFLIITASEIEAEQYPAFANFLEACHRTERWSVSLRKSVALAKDLALSPITEIRPAEIVDRRAFYHRWWPEVKDEQK